MPITTVARSSSPLARLFLTAAALLAATSPPACHAAHNITAILAGHRDLAEFSRELTATGLADDINARYTITVLAVDDARMAPLLKARARETLRHVLSLHVLVDYYDDAKLHRGLPGGSADVSTLFQASGDAPGSAGMVTISVRRGGRVAFTPHDDDDGSGSGSGNTNTNTNTSSGAVFYVRSVHQAPYNISVLQVSGVISSPAAEAPSAAAAATAPPPSSRRRSNVSDVDAGTEQGELSPGSDGGRGGHQTSGSSGASASAPAAPCWILSREWLATSAPLLLALLTAFASG